MRIAVNSSKINRFIVVEGPIGVGKTTLARKLAQTFQGELVLEDAENNPFLERFYQDPRAAALPTQLYFLFQRHRQMQALMQCDMFTPITVSDYLIDKDRLFAEATLTNDELDLYVQAFQHLALSHPQPDLVIYLQAPAQVLMRRVRQRGRAVEAPIRAEYLQRIVDAYTQFFHYYSASPLLIVNASGLDLINDQDDYQTLLERIDCTRSGRNYFNPLAGTAR